MGKKKDVAPILSAMGVLMSIVTDLVKFVTKLGGTMEAIHRLATPEGAETLEKVAKVIVDGFNKNQVKNNFLRLISSTEELIIEALDGKAIIAEAEKVFKAYISSGFRNCNLNNSGKATEETAVAVYEMTANATFVQMFGSLADNLDQLVMSQSQIIRFCEKYPDWLRQDGYATFFLIKESGAYFVVYVDVRGDGLRVFVYHLEYDGVWFAEIRRRLVTPQL